MKPSTTTPRAPGALHRVSTWSYLHRKAVTATWILLLVVINIIAGQVKGDHHADYAAPGAESTEARELLDERFPARAGDTVSVVFHNPSGIDADQTNVDALLTTIRGTEHVLATTSPWDREAQGQVSVDGTTGFAVVQLDTTADNLPIEVGKEMITAANHARDDGLDVELAGQTIDQAQAAPIGSEVIGMVIAAVILLIAFGSLIAMGLPLLTAIFGVGVGLALGEMLTRIMDVPDWAGSMASMIGIGVGIDYALLIVTRYRDELDRGRSPAESVRVAMTTAGRSVVFAGITVVISLLGMLTMNQPFVAGVAFSAVLAVIIVVAAALTLLPALLGFVGLSINRLSVPGRRHRTAHATTGTWYRWSRFVQRRPIVTGLAGALMLGALTLPLTDLRLGFPDASNDPTSQTTRRAYDMLSTGFGAGFNGTFTIVADKADEPALATLAVLTETIKNTDGVAQAVGPYPSPRNDAAIIIVTPNSGPQAEATEQLLNRLRNDVIPAETAGTELTARVGGFVAASVDQTTSITSRLPLFIGAVIVLSFLLLLAVFRSVLVAAKAALLNLLSILASYGVVAYATQGGWFGELFGINEPTPVPAFIPMIMFAILFGLSMDYEVFLLSRVREEYLRTGNNSTAVADGLAATANVITAAAAIMTAVFGAFVLGSEMFLKIIGLGLAAAIVIDATIIRLILVPSTMQLLGDRNWWMPTWLDRIVPVLDVESTSEHQPTPNTDTHHDEPTDQDQELVSV